MLCTLPPVDPSENVTLMNLRPKTGYSVRVQLSRPGEGGEGAWGPPTLMTTDCPGERPRVTPFCSPGVTVPCSRSGVVSACRPRGSLPFPLEVVPGGSPSRPAPRTYQTVLTSTSGPRALVEAVAGGLACGGPRPAASELVLTPGAGAAGGRWFPATPVGRGPGTGAAGERLVPPGPHCPPDRTHAWHPLPAGRAALPLHPPGPGLARCTRASAPQRYAWEGAAGS